MNLSESYDSHNSLDVVFKQPASKRKRIEESSFKSQCHYQEAFELFNTMKRKNLFCDVVLVADGVEIFAHRMLLAACSRYFYAMFSNFEERKRDRIEIKEIDSFALELLIDYVYTAKILVTEENVQTLLSAANLLQFSVVLDVCCDFLKSHLHPTNCLSIGEFASLHGCLNLSKAADAYVKERFLEVMEGEEFLSLSVCQVIEIIKSDELFASEEKVFECVMKWIRQDVENRQNHLPSLMAHVRLPLTSREYLLKNVNEEPLIQNNLQCLEYVDEAQKFLLLEPQKRALMQTMRTKHRKNKALLVIGGRSAKTGVECYVLSEERWFTACDMPSQRKWAALAHLENKVYFIGGSSGGSTHLKTVDEYDTRTNRWSPGVPMNSKRSSAGVVVLNNKIYAIGGYDGVKVLKTAEVFDPTTRQWKMIAPMSTCRRGAGVGVLNNRIYAVGGYEKRPRAYHDTVEYYNLESDTWHEVSNMSCKRYGAGVSVMDGILYAVGGYNGNIALDTVETYDPITDIWKPIANMTCSRRHAGVVSYNGLLYAVGGFNGLESLASVEVYCAQNDMWTLLPESMNVNRGFATAALIDRPHR